MNTAFRRLLLWLLLPLGGCAATLAPPRDAVVPAPAPVLLVSIDGYGQDFLQRGLSPTLAMLAREGVQAASMQPAFPSLTFPNHYTLVTGLTPDHHGVVANTMRDPQLGRFAMADRAAVADGRWWAQGVPIWETASEHGLRSATMFWPGSEAAIHGHHPDYWRPYDATVTADQRVDQVFAWLDLPAAQRPTFITLYFDAVDRAGHAFGPNSLQVDQALRDTDAALARLLGGLRSRGLWQRVNLIVVSDHGMAATPEDQHIPIDQLVRLDSVRTVGLGVLAGFDPLGNSPTAREDFAQAQQALLRQHPHMRCWNKADVPARFAYGHNPRVPQLLCLANTGWRIVVSDPAAPGNARRKLGDHGYDNTDPHMQAIFVAHGPAFRTGVRVAAFPNVDVYPLLAHLLDLPPAANDGDYDAVRDMLKPAAR